MPNASGVPIPYNETTDPVEQICGRIIKLDTIAQDAGLNLVRTPKNLGLASSQTGGVLPHLYVTHEAGGLATTEAQISITMM